MNEAELLQRSQAGEWEAFELLLGQYREVLARTAYLTTRDRESVPDIVQEALVQIWRGLPSYRPYGSLKAWMVKIVINQARKAYRRKRIETVPLETVAEMSGHLDGPEVAAIRQDEAHGLHAAIESLSADHREVLVLRYYTDLTVPEIAKVLACREGTVKSRLSRALGRLEDPRPYRTDPWHSMNGPGDMQWQVRPSTDRSSEASPPIPPAGSSCAPSHRLPKPTV